MSHQDPGTSAVRHPGKVPLADAQGMAARSTRPRTEVWLPPLMSAWLEDEVARRNKSSEQIRNTRIGLLVELLNESVASPLVVTGTQYDVAMRLLLPHIFGRFIDTNDGFQLDANLYNRLQYQATTTSLAYCNSRTGIYSRQNGVDPNVLAAIIVLRAAFPWL